MNRRKFLKLAAGTAFTGSILSGCGKAEVQRLLPSSTLGIQLYTIREAFERDYEAPLRQLADIGFRDFEFAGYFDHDPKQIRALLDSLGAQSNSSHVRLNAFQDDFAAAMETADLMKQTYLVLPWLAPEERINLDQYKAIAELLNRRGEEARAAGKRVVYHNHDFEFQKLEGQIPFDILLSETDSSLVEFELDFYWVHKTGLNAVDIFRKAPGRFPLCHVKDASVTGDIAAVGEGVIDFANIFSAAETAGLKHFYAEHDNASDPFQAMSKSWSHLMQVR